MQHRCSFGQTLPCKWPQHTRGVDHPDATVVEEDALRIVTLAASLDLDTTRIDTAQTSASIGFT